MLKFFNFSIGGRASTNVSREKVRLIFRMNWQQAKKPECSKTNQMSFVRELLNAMRQFKK